MLKVYMITVIMTVVIVVVIMMAMVEITVEINTSKIITGTYTGNDEHCTDTDGRNFLMIIIITMVILKIIAFIRIMTITAIKK
jgi:hypothetical protein